MIGCGRPESAPLPEPRGVKHSEFLTDPTALVVEEHERLHVFRWWVSRPSSRDVYALYVVRYELHDGKPIGPSEYRTRDGWQSQGDGALIEPLFEIPGEILHVLNQPGVDTRSIEEWIADRVTAATAALVAAVGLST